MDASDGETRYLLRGSSLRPRLSRVHRRFDKGERGLMKVDESCRLLVWRNYELANEDRKLIFCRII